MFKELIELLRKNNIICKKLDEINLNTRKKIKAYLGVNLKDEYCFIIKLDKNIYTTKEMIEIEKQFTIRFQQDLEE